MKKNKLLSILPIVHEKTLDHLWSFFFLNWLEQVRSALCSTRFWPRVVTTDDKEVGITKRIFVATTDRLSFKK